MFARSLPTRIQTIDETMLPVNSLAIAVVNARDVNQPENLDDPSATCRIKMSEVSIEGLRQAFMDPESRIRLNSRDGESELEQHALNW